MKNLIKKSFEIDPNCFNVKKDGTKTPIHQVVTVKIPSGDFDVYYSIQRGNGISESYIEMRKVNTFHHYTCNTYWKWYEDNTKFENAIKRIEKKTKQ